MITEFINSLISRGTDAVNGAISTGTDIVNKKIEDRTDLVNRVVESASTFENKLTSKDIETIAKSFLDLGDGLEDVPGTDDEPTSPDCTKPLDTE